MLLCACMQSSQVCDVDEVPGGLSTKSKMDDELEFDKDVDPKDAKPNDTGRFSLRGIIDSAAHNSTGIILSYGNVVGGAVETVGERVGDVVGGTVGAVGGAVKEVYKRTPDFDVLPDATKIDHLVDTWTYVGYGVGTAAAVGVLYYTLRTTRELAQWRAFLRRRRRSKT